MHTIVSLYPVDINEEKPGMIPGNYFIKGAPDGDFSLLHVGDAYYNLYVRDEIPSIKVPIASEDVARGIVNDWIIGRIGCIPGEAQPGLFYLPGKLTKDEVTKNYSTQVETARTMQRKWYAALVRITDNDWAKAPGFQRAVTRDARHAALSLGLDRPWIAADSALMKPIKYCPACQTQLAAAAVICFNCKAIIDKEGYKKLTFAGENG